MNESEIKMLALSVMNANQHLLNSPTGREYVASLIAEVIYRQTVNVA